MNSSELKGFLTGLIIGDGTIDKGIKKRSFRIKSVNIDFIDYIHESLDSCTNFKMQTREFSESFKDGVKRRPYKELTIKSHPYFAKKYHHFYDDYRGRRITSEALNWLNPSGLANWYMSDGYCTLVGKKSGKVVDRRVELSTDRYPLYVVEMMKDYLEYNYGYKIKIIDRKRKDQYRLRISLLDAQNFFLMINPYVVKSMKYKINMFYDYKPKWMNDEYYHLMREITECEAPNKIG